MMNNGPVSACEILYVDDEEKALKYFRMAFSSLYTIHTAASAKEGLEILRQGSGRIGIVISDQRMPEMQGAEFLGRVREEYPHVVRILTTAYSDLDSAIQAVNRGHIYQYVVKPWESQDLGMVLQRAADYYRVLSERNQLLALKLSTLQRILSGDRLLWLLLGPAAGETGALCRRALRSYLEVLPAPSFPSGEMASAAHFEARAVLQSEYANAVKGLAALGQPAPGDEAGWGRQRDEQLGKFAALTGGQYQGGEAAVAVTLPVGLTADAAAREIFGLLLAREAGEAAIAFFQGLLAVAALTGSLTVTVADGPKFTFTPKEGEARPEDLIDLLYRRMSAWDVGAP